MSDVTASRRLPWRRTFAAATCLALIGTPAIAHAAEEDASTTWNAEVNTLESGVRSGYQLAIDNSNGQVYAVDAQWRVDAKALGTVESTPGTNSMRSTFSPYGVAVDGTLGESGVAVTTTARQRDAAAGYGGGVVIYDLAQGAPTDADRVFEFEDGSPILAGPRRVAVNTNTHYAFVTNLGAARSSMGPGFILVLDLTKRGAEAVVARVGLPGEASDTAEGWWTNPVSGVSTEGIVGVAVDEENNLVYLGTMSGQNLYVLDANKIDGTKDNKDTQAYAGAITKLDAVIGDNARPTYNADTKKVYVSAYDDSTITVVHADPTDTARYGTVEKVIDVTTGLDTGARGTNAVEIDAERGLLYSANLDAGVTVYDINNDYAPIAFTAEDGTTYTDIPTSGRAVNFGLDEATGKVWVSTWSSAGTVDIIQVSASAAPAISAQPENAEADAGQTAIFTVGVTGAPAPAIQWQSQSVGGAWTDVPGATSASLEVVAERALDGTRYRAVLENEHGEATSEPATLSVNHAPVVTAAPLSTTAEVGGTATFTASSQAKPAATVVWQVKAGESDWEIVDGATSTTLTVAGVTREDRGNQYRAVFVNRLGEVATAAATLAVDVPRPGAPEWDAPATTEDLLQEDAGDITGAQTGTTVTIGNIPVADDEWVQVFGYTDARYVGAHLVSGGSTTVDVSAFAVGKHHLAVFSTTGELFGYVPFEILPSGTGPTPDTDTDSKVLPDKHPDTGAELPLGLLAAGGLLVLGAGAILMIARRRSTTV